MFPNPVSLNKTLFVNFNGTPQKQNEIIISDIAGKIIYKTMSRDKNISINLSNLNINKGLYIIHVQFDEYQIQSQLFQVVD